MTLSERLNDYKTRNKLSTKGLSWKTGISEPTLRGILRSDHQMNGKTILIFVDRLGPEFEEYLEYKICACGKQYVPQTYHQEFCSEICRERARGRVSQQKDPLHRLKEQKKEKLMERKQKFPKPKVTFAEFNERARSQGLSYGQLQGLERLGMR